MLIKHAPAQSRFLTADRNPFVTVDGEAFALMGGELMGYEVYPLQLRRVALGTEIVFDRSCRRRGWFILDLIANNPSRHET